MDVMAFFRNGITVGVVAVVGITALSAIDSVQLVSTIASSLVHEIGGVDADVVAQPLVDAIGAFAFIESTPAGVNSINLNHLFNI